MMECESESRRSYLSHISEDFSDANNELLPSTSQQRSYDEALGHLVHLFSNKKDRDSTSSFPGNSCCQKEGRKFQLKKILNLLQKMERNNDPPADHEMKYYLLIKKYIRSIMTFFSARQYTDHAYENKYNCYSDFIALQHVEELIKLNDDLADLSEFVSNMDIQNGSLIKPLMGVNDDYEAAPLITGSKERSNRFYSHKFTLAYYDISSSVSAYFPPGAQEKKSYLHILGELSSLIPSKEEAQDKFDNEVNVYSEDLYQLYLSKMGREVIALERHCRRIKTSILDKLPTLNKCWESLARDYSAYADSDDEMSVKLRYKLAEKCQVSKEELPKYIASLERCRDIAFSLFMFINARDSDDVYLPRTSVADIRAWFGWEALHALTLLKTGRSSRKNVFRENLLRDHVDDVSLKKRKHVDDQEEEHGENVKILKAIINDLRHIGDSDMKIDMEENDLIHKIWLRVASSVHFFVSAMAYEQHRYVVSRGRKIKVRTSTRKRMAKDCINEGELVNMIFDLKIEMVHLSKVLHQYSRALHEKLGALELNLCLTLSL